MPDSKLITIHNPKSPVAEAYRILRTNIQFSSLDKLLKTYLITSSGPGEGKSVTTANLGVAFAQDGRRVIIVDADLRKPRQHRLFEQSKKTGLTNVLLGEASIEEVLIDSGVPGLSLIVTGPIPPNPAELVGSQRMKQFLREIGEMADVVLIDSPPVVAVTDAAILAAEVDGVLLVVAANASRIDLARKAKELLFNVKANVVGTVLNMVEEDGSDYYYYYYYGERKKKKKRGLENVPAASI